MAADSSKARNLIGELRGCLDKLGQAVDQSSSKSVASVPNGAHRGGPASSDDVEKRIAAAEAGRKRAEKLLNEALEAKKEAEMRAAEAEQGRANVQQLLSWVHEAEKKKKMTRQHSGGREGFQSALKIALGDDEEIDFAVLAPDEEMLRAVFDEWDTDQNGTLSKEELRSALRQLQQDVSDRELTSLMAWLDADGNAQVDFFEFKRAALAPSQVQLWLSSMPLVKLIATAFPGGSDAKPLAEVARLTEKEVRGRLAELVDPLTAVIMMRIRELKRAMEAKEQEQEQERGREGGKPLTSSKFANVERGRGGGGGGGQGEGEREGGEIGLPMEDAVRGMEQEHEKGADAHVEFQVPELQCKTTPAREWRLVAGGKEEGASEGGRRRVLRTMEEYGQTESARQAGLEPAEILAVVLYSGPMHYVYNAVLRQYPPPMVVRNKGNRYCNTVQSLVSAVLKLMAAAVGAQEGQWLYRALPAGSLPLEFYHHLGARGAEGEEKGGGGGGGGAGGARGAGAGGYTEWGFLSTTSSLAVACEGCGVHDAAGSSGTSQDPKVMAFQVSAQQRGAFIGELSQFPEQSEFLWPPRSILHPSAAPGAEQLAVSHLFGPVTLVPVTVTPPGSNAGPLQDHFKFQLLTLSQHRSRRQQLFLSLLRALVSEVRRDADSATLFRKVNSRMIERIQGECVRIVEKYGEKAPDWFTDDANLQSAVAEAVEANAKALRELKADMPQSS